MKSRTLAALGTLAQERIVKPVKRSLLRLDRRGERAAWRLIALVEGAPACKLLGHTPAMGTTYMDGQTRYGVCALCGLRIWEPDGWELDDDQRPDEVCISRTAKGTPCNTLNRPRAKVCRECGGPVGEGPIKLHVVKPVGVPHA